MRCSCSGDSARLISGLGFWACFRRGGADLGASLAPPQLDEIPRTARTNRIRWKDLDGYGTRPTYYSSRGARGARRHPRHEALARSNSLSARSAAVSPRNGLVESFLERLVQRRAAHPTRSTLLHGCARNSAHQAGVHGEGCRLYRVPTREPAHQRLVANANHAVLRDLKLYDAIRRTENLNHTLDNVHVIFPKTPTLKG